MRLLLFILTMLVALFAFAIGLFIELTLGGFWSPTEWDDERRLGAREVEANRTARLDSVHGHSHEVQLRTVEAVSFIAEARPATPELPGGWSVPSTPISFIGQSL